MSNLASQKGCSEMSRHFHFIVRALLMEWTTNQQTNIKVHN